MTKVLFPSSSKKGRVAIARKGFTGQLGETVASVVDDSVGATASRRDLFWTLMEVIEKHSFLRASMSLIGRSVIGAGWSIVEHPEYPNGRQGQRRKLYRFYTATKRGRWDNINDFYGDSYKFMIAAMYLKYFGQVAFHIVRDQNGKPYSLDHLPGLVIPNVNSRGQFRKPAFKQYLNRSGTKVAEFNDPNDVVYITNPDWAGSPLGGSDVQSLSTYTLPIDIYLQGLAREYLKNSNRPELVYMLPEETSDEAFDAFLQEIEARWTGVRNAGRSPVVVQGKFDVKRLGDLPDALPYQDSRLMARDETLATVSVPGAKLGLTDGLSQANFKESRREFHESTILPLFKLLEEGFYRQVHIREFNAPGWLLSFNSPDFLTVVERATVDRRYYDINSVTPNEIRKERGLPPRDGGDLFKDELEEVQNEAEEYPGAPPEGRPLEPDSPSRIGEPNENDEDPVRGDQHDDTTQRVLKELTAWKRFAKNRLGKKSARKFEPIYIDGTVASVIQSAVDLAKTPEDIDFIFSTVREEVGNGK